MVVRVIKAMFMGALFRRWLKSRKKNGQVSNDTSEFQTIQENSNSEPLPTEGAAASVYWGQLPDGTQIAVKRLNSENMKTDKEFALEAERLGKLQHKNVLRLRGYCVEKNQRILVSDYMPNSSLLAHLHGAFAYDSHLDWKKRMAIVRGCAEGLAYLHHHAYPHGDIKSSNILLSLEYEPMYADSGIASLMKKSVIRSKGLGYTAPECSAGEDATKESDVFSFGILILEILSGRRPMEKVEFSLKQHIVDWAEPLIVHGKLVDLIDPKLKLSTDFVTDELKRLVFVATICAQTKSESRPSMIRVVQLLQGIGK